MRRTVKCPACGEKHTIYGGGNMYCPNQRRLVKVPELQRPERPTVGKLAPRGKHGGSTGTAARMWDALEERVDNAQPMERAEALELLGIDVDASNDEEGGLEQTLVRRCDTLRDRLADIKSGLGNLSGGSPAYQRLSQQLKLAEKTLAAVRGEAPPTNKAEAEEAVADDGEEGLDEEVAPDTPDAEEEPEAEAEQAEPVEAAEEPVGQRIGAQPTTVKALADKCGCYIKDVVAAAEAVGVNVRVGADAVSGADASLIRQALAGAASDSELPPGMSRA